jgi:hypothetical protein
VPVVAGGAELHAGEPRPDLPADEHAEPRPGQAPQQSRPVQARGGHDQAPGLSLSVREVAQ